MFQEAVRGRRLIQRGPNPPDRYFARVYQLVPPDDALSWDAIEEELTSAILAEWSTHAMPESVAEVPRAVVATVIARWDLEQAMRAGFITVFRPGDVQPQRGFASWTRTRLFQIKRLRRP